MSDRSKAKKTRSPAVAARSCCDPGTIFREPTPPAGPPPPVFGDPPGGVSGVLLQAASTRRAPTRHINFACINIPLVPDHTVTVFSEARATKPDRKHPAG